jgi:hypothetical protein
MRRKKKYFFLLEMADEERQTPFRIMFVWIEE